MRHTLSDDGVFTQVQPLHVAGCPKMLENSLPLDGHAERTSNYQTERT